MVKNATFNGHGWKLGVDLSLCLGRFGRIGWIQPFFQIDRGKTASVARHWINVAPQTGATTFAFASVSILLLRQEEIQNITSWNLESRGTMYRQRQLLSLAALCIDRGNSSPWRHYVYCRQRQLLSLAAVVLLSYKALFHAIARMDSSSARLKRAREKTHFNVTTMFGAYGVSTKLYI